MKKPGLVAGQGRVVPEVAASGAYCSTKGAN